MVKTNLDVAFQGNLTNKHWLKFWLSGDDSFRICRSCQIHRRLLCRHDFEMKRIEELGVNIGVREKMFCVKMYRDHSIARP
jgi:hypothetical protein